MGVPEILQAVVDRVPPPKDAVEEPTKALIFDSYYRPLPGRDRLFPGNERPDQLQRQGAVDGQQEDL